MHYLVLQEDGPITGGAYNRRGVKGAVSVICYSSEIEIYSIWGDSLSFRIFTQVVSQRIFAHDGTDFNRNTSVTIITNYTLSIGDCS